MRPTRLTTLTVLLALGLLPALMAPASADAASVPGTTAALLSSHHASPAARHALQHVQDIFKHKSHAEAEALVDQGTGRDATMAMRDLWLHRDQLSGSDQTAAARVLARPGTETKTCNGAVCVHYDLTGSNASTPTYAKTVLRTVTHVYQAYVGAGYRRPAPDGTVGTGNNIVDIYLKDVFPMGYYGYCSPDQRVAGPKGSHVATAYCVLDNDYANFPGDPTNDLRVTAAHEFFHAVQFAYDYAEDHWLMEGTATWAEDQLYTNINDNLQYLPFGQLRKPRIPLDRSDTLAEYGNWIFFRYLSERLRTTSGGLPLITRRIWEAADSSRGARHDRYSTWAISVALRGFHRSFRQMYAGFAEANHRSRTAYREGQANHYPVAPVAGKVRLRPAKQKASGSYKLNHLTSAAERFTPRKLGRRAKLRVSVDLRAKRSGAALLTVFRRGGGSTTRWIRLNRSGNGHAAVAFNPRGVANVLLTVVDSGTAFRCWQGTAYSCRGVSKQDGLLDRWTARVV